MTATHLTFLAKGDIDWLQLIVFLLVIGGSVLGTISKKLIAYFGGDKAVTKDKPATRPRDHRRVAKPRATQPNQPVARPFHASPTQKPLTRPIAMPRRAIAKQMPPHVPPPRKAPPIASAQDTDLPELLAEIIGFPKPKTHQLQPKKPNQPAPLKKPKAPTQPKRANLAPRGELRTSRRRPLATGLPSTQGLLTSKSKQGSLHKKSVSKHKAADGRHLIHLEDVADLDDTLHTSQQAYESFVTGHALRPTPMALRKAVILNEILQPPVSLRTDPF